MLTLSMTADCQGAVTDLVQAVDSVITRGCASKGFDNKGGGSESLGVITKGAPTRESLLQVVCFSITTQRRWC